MQTGFGRRGLDPESKLPYVFDDVLSNAHEIG